VAVIERRERNSTRGDEREHERGKGLAVQRYGLGEVERVERNEMCGISCDVWVRLRLEWEGL
jgi:hypothetical protein